MKITCRLVCDYYRNDKIVASNNSMFVNHELIDHEKNMLDEYDKVVFKLQIIVKNEVKGPHDMFIPPTILVERIIKDIHDQKKATYIYFMHIQYRYQNYEIVSKTLTHEV